MSRVNASPESLRTFAREVRAFSDGQNEISQRLKASYSNLGSEWNDKQYEMVGQAIEHIMKMVNSTLPICEEISRDMEGKATLLDEYNS